MGTSCHVKHISNWQLSGKHHPQLISSGTFQQFHHQLLLEPVHIEIMLPLQGIHEPRLGHSVHVMHIFADEVNDLVAT